LKINLYDIPKEIENTIKNNEEKIINLSKYLKNEKDLYIIGRGINYYSSMEIALKLKEISYIHAEALSGGELKHGTLALIEEGTKVLSLNPYWDDNIKTNIEEILARGGIVYKIPGDFNISESFPDFTIYSVIIGQLLTYYIAREKRLPIDYPRNLAKSVTVK
ncbi:MAG: SIS domain-containing protein, partial [Nanopusillaceae archaeon]